MSSSATVAGDARMRVFVGYPVPAQEREEVSNWGETTFAGVRGARPVPAANLHLTVAFLGSIDAARVSEVAGAVREASAGRRRPRFASERFRATRSVGMLVLRDLDGGGTELALDVQTRLEALGVYERERREWLPHVTVMRWKERPTAVRTYVPVMEIVPSEIAVYLSVLRVGGAQYDVLESAALGG
jgi:2'-5' RNA ligase